MRGPLEKGAHMIDLHADGTASCSEHGDTVILTTGQWTGRAMLECTECGTYVIVEGTEHD